MDSEQALSQHFMLREFLHEGKPDGITSLILNHLSQTAHALEEVRTLFRNRPITITSGFRTPQHNKDVGGVPHSLHCSGMAADIVVEGLNPKEVQKRLQNWNGGLGCYSEWTHVDLGKKRRWWGP